MEQRTIKQSIDIDAAKEKVWAVLFDDEFTRKWYTMFSEGSHAVTDWKVGSKAVFKDNSNSGIIGEVIANEPHEFLSLRYYGIVTNSKEDFESDVAQRVKGGMETYRLTENSGITNVSITCDMSADIFEMMSSAWEKALKKVKELAETK